MIRRNKRSHYSVLFYVWQCSYINAVICQPGFAPFRMEASCLELALEGERLCKAGDFKGGTAFFEAAVQVGTEDLKTLSAIYSQLGNAYFYLKEYGKALEYHKHDLTLARWALYLFNCKCCPLVLVFCHCHVQIVILCFGATFLKDLCRDRPETDTTYLFPNPPDSFYRKQSFYHSENTTQLKHNKTYQDIHGSSS